MKFREKFEKIERTEDSVLTAKADSYPWQESIDLDEDYPWQDSIDLDENPLAGLYRCFIT